MDWHHEDGRIYSTDEGGQVLAEATLAHTAEGIVDVTHVYVSPTLRGQGVASETMLAIIAHLRDHGLRATASCSYANSWFMKNREQVSVVFAEEMGDLPAACRIDGRH